MNPCRICGRSAVWTITAAYPACAVVHPHFATYPAPMSSVCDEHLAEVMRRDGDAPGSTPAYLVKRIGA